MPASDITPLTLITYGKSLAGRRGPIMAALAQRFAMVLVAQVLGVITQLADMMHDFRRRVAAVA